MMSDKLKRDKLKRFLFKLGTRPVVSTVFERLLFGLLLTALLLSMVKSLDTVIVPIPILSETAKYLGDMRHGLFVALGIFVIGIICIIYNKENLDRSSVERSFAALPRSSWRQRVAGHSSVRHHWGILLLLLVGAFAYYARGISVLDFSNDEFQVVDTAYGYLETGSFRKWDFCFKEITKSEYLRAFPHTWLVAQAIDLFGMNEWSARLVSVVFGVVLVCIGYLVTYYFTRNRRFSMLAAGCLILHPVLSELFKVTRMYSMLAPLFLGLFFCTHRVFIGLDAEGFGVLKKPLGLLLLPALLLLVGLNGLVHINALTILPYALFFAIVMALATRRRAFFWLVGMGLLASGVLFLVSLRFGLLKVFTYHMSMFESSNYRYIRDLISFPFGFSFGLGCMLLSLVMIFFSRDRMMRIHVLSLFSATAVGVVFFVFIAHRYYASKYISFLMPVSVIWIVSSFYLVAGLLKSRWARGALFATAALTVAVPLSQMKPIVKEIDYKTAYATIKANYEAGKRETIAGQYLRCYYLRGAGNRANLFNLGRRQQVSYGAFMRRLKRTTSGWVTWATQKRGHIKPRIQYMANHCFEKVHGTGVDKTGVEVFHYHQDSPCIRKRRRIPRRFEVLVDNGRVYDDSEADEPVSPDEDAQKARDGAKKPKPLKYIDMDLSSPFTVAFWVRSRAETPGAPISFGSTFKNSIEVESRSDLDIGGFRFRYGKRGRCSAIVTGYINDNTWHSVALYQEGGKKGDEIGVYVDGRLSDSCRLKTAKKKKARFLTNVFNGRVQDIRIYNTALTEPEIQAIYNSHEITLSSRLTAAGETFVPRYHLVDALLKKKRIK
jgi:4-amino-4-deoxy-L-arabinose transferase-like glycosyltransferase